MLNTGDRPGELFDGLLTTLAYKLGSADPAYALEGSIAVTGALVQWFRDNIGLIGSTPEIETLALTVEDNGGCYFVPAFSGLFAPHWRSDARGVIAGLTSYINRGHLARAVLEATAWQTREVVEAMNTDYGGELLRTARRRRDDAERPVDAERSRHPRRAGHATDRRRDRVAGRGIHGRPRRWLLAGHRQPRRTGARQPWLPSMDAAVRERGYRKWKKAVARAVPTGSTTTSEAYEV